MNLTRSSIALSLLASVGASALASHAVAQGLSERIRGVADQRAQERAQDSSRASLLGALLYTDVAVNFDKTAARTAFEYVADQMGVPLVVRYDGEGGSGGIDPEMEISLQLEGAPALTVLERLLEMCATDEACTWQLRDGFVEAGTKERLSVPAARELRMYPVRDLLFEPPYFDNAPDFNLNAAIQQGGQQGAPVDPAAVAAASVVAEASAAAVVAAAAVAAAAVAAAVAAAASSVTSAKTPSA